MSKVRSTIDGFVGVGGVPVLLSVGDEYDSDDALVQAHPDKFTKPAGRHRAPAPDSEPTPAPEPAPAPAPEPPPAPVSAVEPPARPEPPRRGRPPGSKNKPKTNGD